MDFCVYNLRVFIASAKGASESENFRLFRRKAAYDVLFFKFHGGGDKCTPCLALRALMPRRLQFSSRMRRQYCNTCTVATYKRTTKIGLQNVIKRLQFRARGVIAVSNQYALIANYQGQNLRRCTASERARSRTHAQAAKPDKIVGAVSAEIMYA